VLGPIVVVGVVDARSISPPRLPRRRYTLNPNNIWVDELSGGAGAAIPAKANPAWVSRRAITAMLMCGIKGRVARAHKKQLRALAGPLGKNKENDVLWQNSVGYNVQKGEIL
jgi:hypothetical protein